MRRIFTGVALALLLAAPAAPAQAPSSSRTHYVFVHGAWGGGWDWRQVDSLLTGLGHDVTRVTLTGLGERVHLASPEVGLETHIADVVNAIEWERLRNVVLVGHSYGGMVITGVADRIPERIARLVYVDAMVPASGESVQSIMGADFERTIREARDGFIPASWEPADRPVPKDVPQPLKTFTDTLRLRHPAGPPVPADYVLTFEPGAEPDRFQRFADRAAARGWPVHRMEADHVPERSAPDELVALLSRITAR
jgi:pimeloyl-ACP methyl ester carboxylesterase